MVSLTNEKDFNKFTTLPFIPYNIVLTLMENENIFKILKYSDYDCLSKPNLTQKEKVVLLWKNQDNQQDYSIFLTPLVENMMYDSKTILKVYRFNDVPVNYTRARVCYAFDVLYGDKISLIEYEGIPCARADVMQAEIMKTLNGAYIGGLISELQYSSMSNQCRSTVGINGNNKFTGVTFVMVGELSCL